MHQNQEFDPSHLERQSFQEINISKNVNIDYHYLQESQQNTFFTKKTYKIFNLLPHASTYFLYQENI